jgi:hypothetical protein
MKLLKEPMLHFVIAGTLLFAVDAFFNRDQAAWRTSSRSASARERYAGFMTPLQTSGSARRRARS